MDSRGSIWKKSMSFGIVLLTLKYQNLRIFFIIKKFCRTLGVNAINSKVSPQHFCIRKIQTGAAIYFNHVDRGHGEHDYNDVQMFQFQLYLYSTSTLFQMKYWSPTAALYANHQPGTLCVLQMVASEIPQLRSFVNNYFMLISEMLVKV